MKRATHNLGHYRVTAGDFGLLYPFSVTEVLPGDTLRSTSSALLRMQPLMTPLMHPVDIGIASFYVPHRITWPGFEDFITGRNPTAVIPELMEPTAKDNIEDYMGVPVGTTNRSALPVRAYNLIWNEFYRDQDLQTERPETDVTVANVAWTKDYFTTARLYPQFGADSEAATIQFAQDVPVLGIGAFPTYPSTTAGQTWRESDGTERQYPFSAGTNAGTTYGIELTAQTGAEGGRPNVRVPAGSTAGTLDINEWRRAMALQRFREHRNKFGSRYKDYLAFLGVNSPDGRLDRPEYLGGGRQTISFSEVLQTVEDTSNNVPLGTQAGHGIAHIRTRPWRRFFTEHGYVVHLMHVRPRNMYMTAMDRTWLRRTKDDFWQKENELLGEQPVLAREIYATGGDPAKVFGYSPRHDDYRTQRSYATGVMRDSTHNTWHMARDFQSEPALNDEFIKCVPTKRVLRSTNDPAFYTMIQNRILARRLVSKHARH